MPGRCCAELQLCHGTCMVQREARCCFPPVNGHGAAGIAQGAHDPTFKRCYFFKQRRGISVSALAIENNSASHTPSQRGPWFQPRGNLSQACAIANLAPQASRGGLRNPCSRDRARLKFERHSGRRPCIISQTAPQHRHCACRPRHPVTEGHSGRSAHSTARPAPQ